MTERTVNIGGQQVKMRASALIPRLYRFKFGRDMLSDMHLLQDDAKGVVKAAEQGKPIDFQPETLTVFENVAWMFAKHADPEVPDSVEDWLEGFDGILDIYSSLPEIFELWALNNATTSVPRKK